MVTVDANRWDETVCNMTACQHPPCWETIWRIENGHPRLQLRPLGSTESQFPEYEEELPTLKIVDLPLNCSQKEGIKRDGSFASISKSISSIREARQYPSNSTLNETLIFPSSEKNSFLGLNSRLESHTPHFSSASFNSWKQFNKVQVMDLGEFAVHRLEYPPVSGSFIFKWIPHVQHRRRQPEKTSPRAGSPLQRKGVKEIALESIFACNDSNKAKTKKPNKVPLGGQPFLLQLKKTQQVAASKSSPGQRETHLRERSTRKQQFSSCHLHLAPVCRNLTRTSSLPVTSLSGDEVRDVKERKGWPDSKEKGLPSITTQKAPGLHQFGAKIPTNGKGSRRSRLQFPFEGVGPIGHPSSILVEPLLSVEGQSRERGDLPGNLFPKVITEGRSPQKTCTAFLRKKKPSSVKLVDCQSNLAKIYMAGCDQFAPRLVRTEFRSSQPRGQRRLGSQKEPRMPSSLGQEVWLSKETAQAAAGDEESGGESLPQILSPLGQPPPPPPTPMVSDFGELPAVYLG